MANVRIAARGALAAGGLVGMATLAAWLYACGGTDASAIQGGGDGSVPDASGPDATTTPEPDAGGPGDAMGTETGPCAPPSDPTKAALCVTITAEAVQFLPDDARFDGKGLLIVAIQSSAMPDGGPPLAPAVTFPELDAGADAGLVDLSQPIPMVRIDGLPPATVYPQGLFIDDPSGGLTTPAAGWWLGGYDLSNGLQGAPLEGVTLQAGMSTTATMDLRALRALALTVTVAVPPAGNGQGPLKVLIVDGNAVGGDAGAKAWGFASTECSDPLADGGAKAVGLFVGSGPYYTLPILDDFGLGGDFPPGAMASLDPDAGLTIPAANQFNAAAAYVYPQAVRLNYVNPPPDGGFDDASCP